MDQLPDLQSDTDVDALMARIRARLATPATPAPAPTPGWSGSALHDFLATQEECASVMLRTMQLLADTLEELEGGTLVSLAPVRRAGKPARPRAGGRPRRTG